jgi:hypothetical protein
VHCTLENVPLEPWTRKHNLRSNLVQDSFSCYWEDKFAGKAEPALLLVMAALDENANDALGLKKRETPLPR